MGIWHTTQQMLSFDSCYCLQGQANKWVKNMEGPNGLKVLNLQMNDMARQVRC
jgi:hypothetical protein